MPCSRGHTCSNLLDESVFRGAVDVYKAAFDIPGIILFCTGILLFNGCMVVFLTIQRRRSTSAAERQTGLGCAKSQRTSAITKQQGSECRNHFSNTRSIKTEYDPTRSSSNVPDFQTFSRVNTKSHKPNFRFPEETTDKSLYFQKRPNSHQAFDEKIRIARNDGGKTRWVTLPTETEKKQIREREQCLSTTNKEDEETLDDITWGMDSPLICYSQKFSDLAEEELLPVRPDSITLTVNKTSNPHAAHGEATHQTNSPSDAWPKTLASWGLHSENKVKLSKHYSSPEYFKHTRTNGEQKTGPFQTSTSQFLKGAASTRKFNKEQIDQFRPTKNKRQLQKPIHRQLIQTGGPTNECFDFYDNKLKTDKKKDIPSRPSTSSGVSLNQSDPNLVYKRDSWIWFSTEARPNAEDFTSRKRKFQSSDPRVALIAEEIKRQELQNRDIEREAESLIDSQSILSCALGSEDSSTLDSPHFKFKPTHEIPRGDVTFPKNVSPIFMMNSDSQMVDDKNLKKRNRSTKRLTEGDFDFQSPSVKRLGRHGDRTGQRNMECKDQKRDTPIRDIRKKRVEQSPPRLLYRTSGTNIVDSTDTESKVCVIRENTGDESAKRVLPEDSNHKIYRKKRPTHGEWRPIPNPEWYPDVSDRPKSTEARGIPSGASSESRDWKLKSPSVRTVSSCLTESMSSLKDSKTQEKLCKEMTHIIHSLLFDTELSSSSRSLPRRDEKKRTSPRERQPYLGGTVNCEKSSSLTENECTSWHTVVGEGFSAPIDRMHVDASTKENSSKRNNVLTKENGADCNGNKKYQRHPSQSESKLSQSSKVSNGDPNRWHRKIDIYSKDYYLGKKTSRLRNCELNSIIATNKPKPKRWKGATPALKTSGSKSFGQQYPSKHNLVNLVSMNDKNPCSRSQGRPEKIKLDIHHDKYSKTPQGNLDTSSISIDRPFQSKSQDKPLSTSKDEVSGKDLSPQCTPLKGLKFVVHSKVDSFNETYQPCFLNRGQHSSTLFVNQATVGGSTNNSSSNIVRYKSGLNRSTQNDIIKCFQHCNGDEKHILFYKQKEDDTYSKETMAVSENTYTVNKCSQDSLETVRLYKIEMNNSYKRRASGFDQLSEQCGISSDPLLMDVKHTPAENPASSMFSDHTHQMSTHWSEELRSEEFNLQLTSNPDSGIDESASEKNVSLTC